MIAVEDVHVHAGGTPILRGVNLEVRPGRVTALLGANGAGKSTLLRVVCGDLAEGRGRIRFEGRPLATWSRRAQAQRRAVMMQESSLSFPFPALEVVLMGRSPHLDGGETRRDRDIAREALECMLAGALARRLYPTLSGGEKQRVQLARALAQVWEADGEPRYLLLDEPTANLDPRHQHLVLARIRRFAAEGGAVLIIVHDLNLAAQYADQVVLLKRGEIVAHGATRDTLSETNLAATFDLPLRILRVPELDWPLIYSGGGNDDASEPEPH